MARSILTKFNGIEAAHVIVAHTCDFLPPQIMVDQGYVIEGKYEQNPYWGSVCLTFEEIEMLHKFMLSAKEEQDESDL